MLKTLVYLNADLASSIALRYACQMSKIVEMRLETIHVEEPGVEEQSPGTGWVRQTWETALLKTGEEEIAQLIQAEKPLCPPLPATKMFLGNREEKILQELQKERYDLFLEGTLYSFTSSNFYEKIRSRLFRDASCPFIFVKNLMGLTRIALLFGRGMDHFSVASSFLRIFGKAEVDVDLLYYDFPRNGATPPMEKDAEETLSAARNLLSNQGRAWKECRVIQENPEAVGDLFKNYGLVVSSVQHVMNGRSPLTELLHRIPSPIFLARRERLQGQGR